MDKQIIDFLKLHRISSLSLLMDDGSIHGAAMHYAYDEKLNRFVFLTEKGSRKLSGLSTGTTRPASLVIGFSEEEWVTMQLSGELGLIPEDKLEWGWETYANKFRGADKNKNDPDSVLMEFSPKWWIFTRVKPRPSEVISSED